MVLNGNLGEKNQMDLGEAAGSVIEYVSLHFSFVVRTNIIISTIS